MHNVSGLHLGYGTKLAAFMLGVLLEYSQAEKTFPVDQEYGIGRVQGIQLLIYWTDTAMPFTTIIGNRYQGRYVQFPDTNLS